MRTNKIHLAKSLLFGAITYSLFSTALEFYNIAWGTGNSLGDFSLKWGVLFSGFSLFLTFILLIIWFLLWRPQVLESLIDSLVSMRDRLGFLRYCIAIAILVLPVWFLRYSIWGLVFTGTYFRAFIWMLIVVGLAILLSKTNTLISWNALLLSALLSSVAFVITSTYSNVSAYPFNLFWSDGNRIWDYSIMFGRELYNYPADQSIEAYISLGRQFLWGLPFLLPKSSILFNRFWSALVLSFPYALFGWLTFRSKKDNRKQWLALGLWTFLFLSQGPIYTPLLLSAMLVALAWARPLWLAIPLVLVAGFYAQFSRISWLVAPAMWIGILELSDISMQKSWLPLKKWIRVVTLTFSGLAGGFFIPAIIKSIQSNTLENPAAAITYSLNQPLLWYRLLPNETYSPGIILGLLIAIGPLVILLLKQKILISVWQKIGIALAMLAFLAVGLVASTKIGGGNNLHNLDMFLIGMVFLVAIAWKSGGSEWLSRSERAPLWIKTTLLLFLIIPAYPFLQNLRPRLSLTSAQISQIEVLTDSTVSSMPSNEEVQQYLEYISSSVESADKQGEVLFIDGRQLLTFEYVPKVRLVPEYEKKQMMDQAMSSNASYFAPYYQDLAAQRFSLIVSEPLKIPIKEEGVFSEEGDAWTKWVAAPTLCFYEPIETFKPVHIQLLVPRAEPLDCSDYLITP
ncbi:MAG: hypothetical protein HN560_08780 [Anaerolineae bacterium]|nr:hypothetical protein [Candidatus Jacksonbacteria bacterium]MBT7601158.1 hypothetical protein [Anaerolineae bacterium]